MIMICFYRISCFDLIMNLPRHGSLDCMCVCVCVSVCVSVCPANILVFYFSAIRRDIDLKFIQDTYRVVLNSLKTN